MGSESMRLYNLRVFDLALSRGVNEFEYKSCRYASYDWRNNEEPQVGQGVSANKEGGAEASRRVQGRP